MSKRVIRVSETEASNDFRSVLAHVRAGAEVVIECDAKVVAVVKPPEPHVRRLSDSLQLARNRASNDTLDEEFGRDLDAVIRSHGEPLSPPTWD